MSEETNDIVGAVDSVDEVTVTVLQTVSEMWLSFLSHLPYIFAGVAILLITWTLSQLLSKLGNKVLSRWHSRESLKELILRLLSILIWVLGLLLTAIVIFPGLTPAKALGGLGLVSIAVGLAFKDIFENFFAGILILWRFPFEKGDFIQCEDITGKVEKVWVRMSYIRKTSGELVVVPNSFLFKNPVEILTSDTVRRTTIAVGVAYKEDLAQAVALIEKTVKSCESVRDEHPIQIFPNQFGSSSMDMEVTWWTGSKPIDIRRSRAEVVIAVKAALYNANIEIPFPYRTMTFAEPISIENMHGQNTQAET